MKVYAPGKLILSGEHAVVYGSPALAMAVNRYVQATVTRERLPQILFDLSDIAHHSQLNFNTLKRFKEKVKRKYYRFIRGDFSIREVLQKPFELAHFALSVFAESLSLSLPHGVKIHVQSDIPIGCGMGSSAATILSVMHAISNYLQVSLPQERLFQLALEAENMQHGHSSGLDLRVALQGGCLYLQGEEMQKRPLPSFPLYLINTGTPVTTTGQCVEKVAAHFRTSKMSEDFSAVTRAMDHALIQQSISAWYESIRHNHQLLVTLGVVPQTVQQFIASVEALGGAAKICGAGAVAGEKAGMVLVVTEDESRLASLCSRFGYEFMSIVGESRGVHISH